VADEKFKKAIDALIDYEKRYLSKETVAKRMAAAEAMDQPSSTIANEDQSASTIPKKTKEKLKLHLRKGLQLASAPSGFSRININRYNPRPFVQERTTVEFLIHGSLLDHNPTIVKCERFIDVAAFWS
jgi:hypothetical protein